MPYIKDRRKEIAGMQSEEHNGHIEGENHAICT